MDIETLRTKGSRRVGGSLRWEWRVDEDVPSNLRLIGKRLAKVITSVVTTADGEFEASDSVPTSPNPMSS